MLGVSTTDDTYELKFKKSSDIISEMTDVILTNTSKINDFTEGSVTQTLLEAEATSIEELYYLAIENAEKAIDTSVLNTFGFSRNEATYAYGTVTINFSNELTSNIYIPKGTKFTCSNSNYTETYATLEEYLVQKGSISANVIAYCLDTGVIGNIPAGAIDTTTDISYVSNVTNPSAFQTGSDEESIVDLQTRFRSMIQALSRGTVQSLKYAAMNITDIAGAYIYEETYGTVVVYCHDANGDLSSDLQKSVADALSLWRPAGIQVIVYPTHKSTTTLSIGVDVNSTTLETQDFLDNVKLTIENYINSYTAGETLYISDIVQKVMDISDLGISDCQVELYVNPDASLNTDAYVSDYDIININGTEVGPQQLNPPDITSSDTYGIVSSGTTATTSSSTGQTWQNATTSEDSSGNTIFDPLEITTKYVTSPNEILRSDTISVYFMDNTDYNTNIVTNDMASDGSSLNLDIPVDGTDNDD